MYSGMLGVDQVVRAAGFSAIAKAVNTRMELPDQVRLAVIAGLTDQYLIVGLSAVEAAARIRFAPEEAEEVVKRLLVFVSAYRRRPSIRRVGGDGHWVSPSSDRVDFA